MLVAKNLWPRIVRGFVMVNGIRFEFKPLRGKAPPRQHTLDSYGAGVPAGRLGGGFVGGGGCLVFYVSEWDAGM